MAEIRNVELLKNLSVKKIPGKLSFDVGEVFSARVLKMSVDNLEVVLKLLDGWQFNGKLSKQLDSLPEGLVKFQVEGFEDGKLNISLVKVKSDENTKKSTIEDMLSSEQMDVKEEDYLLLNSMIKHNMPLTKENISKIKTLVDFKNKFSLEEGEKEKFISSYLDSKKIDINSDRGQKIQNILKSVFTKLESLNEEDILTLFENGIDLTEENIDSYKKLFKDQSSTIYSELTNIKEEIDRADYNKIQAQNEKLNSSDAETMTENIEPGDAGSGGQMEAVKAEHLSLQEKYNNKAADKLDFQGNEKNSKIRADDSASKVQNDEKDDKIAKFAEEIISDNGLEDITETTLKDIKPKEIILKAEAQNRVKQEDAIKDEIKQQIKIRIDEMKQSIKDIINKKTETESESYTKILSMVADKANDFKVFNSVSNQYYYMNFPIDINDYKYECKFVIKDDRKSGKKIDSKNVKLVLSISTKNLGTIDAFIKVKDNKMTVDLKCNEEWTNTFQNEKKEILKELSSIGFDVNVNVVKRDKEVSLVNCREFFDDTSISNLDVIV